MNTKFAQTLLVISMGAFAISASAQNNTPRDNPAGTSTYNTNQNGTKTGATPSTTNNGMMNNGMMNNGMMNNGMEKYRALSDTDMRSYKSGWAACEKISGTDQTTCRTKFASTWSQVDPKCQKVSGQELDNCLKGADHGQ